MALRLLVNGIPLLGVRSGVGKYAYEVCRRLNAAGKTFDTTYYYGYRRKRLLSSAGQEEHRSGKKMLHRLEDGLRRTRLIKGLVKRGLQWVDRLYPATYDLSFEPNFILQDNLRAAQAVATVHDFSCFRYPQWHPEERVRYFEKHFWPSVQRASAIITVSSAIRDEAVMLYGMDAAYITVIPNGVDHSLYKALPAEAVEAYRKRRQLNKQFLLCVGTLEPRKNICNLLHAYSALPESVKEHCPLYFAGGEGWSNQNILDALHTFRRHVRVLGFVPEQELPLLYNAATVSVYPSWYEGFGLPALEAMACGCPVLTSDGGALREVCADAAAYFTDIADVPCMSRTLHEYIDDASARQNLAQKGLTRAEDFCWMRSAKAHGELFYNVCQTHA